MDHVFKGAVRVREAQILQQEPGRIRFRIVRASGYSGGDERRLREEAARRLGNEVAVEFEYVDEIPKTGGGKLRFVINEMKSSRTGQYSADLVDEPVG